MHLTERYFIVLDSIKTMLKEPQEVSFDVFYQAYICDIQDQNVQAEVAGIKIDEITSINRLLQRLSSM